MDNDGIAAFLEKNPLASEAEEFIIETLAGDARVNVGTVFKAAGGTWQAVMAKVKLAQATSWVCRCCILEAIADGREMPSVIFSAGGDHACDVFCSSCLAAPWGTFLLRASCVRACL